MWSVAASLHRFSRLPDFPPHEDRTGRAILFLVPNCIHGIDDRFCAVCTNKGRPKPTKRETVQARAAAHDPATDVEREGYEAVYAYQEARSAQSGKPFRASRTWQMIEDEGVVAAIEHLLAKPDDPGRFKALVEMGMEDIAFEHVVVRHRDAFSEKSVLTSEARLKRVKA